MQGTWEQHGIGAKTRAPFSSTSWSSPSAPTDKPRLHGCVTEHVSPDATVYTDEAAPYSGLPNHHEFVKHSDAEYVRDQAHANSMESVWSMPKRAHTSTFHKMFPKPLATSKSSRSSTTSGSQTPSSRCAMSSRGSWDAPSPTGGSSPTTACRAVHGRNGVPRWNRVWTNVFAVAPARSTFGSSFDLYDIERPLELVHA